MFKVSTDEGEYRVSFQYFEEQKRKQVLKSTVCYIEQPNKVVFVESARCNPTDVFDKRVGRKLAFARAVKQFDRNVRQKFWDAYFSYCKQ